MSLSDALHVEEMFGHERSRVILHNFRGPPREDQKRSTRRGTPAAITRTLCSRGHPLEGERANGFVFRIVTLVASRTVEVRTRARTTCHRAYNPRDPIVCLVRVRSGRWTCAERERLLRFHDSAGPYRGCIRADVRGLFVARPTDWCDGRITQVRVRRRDTFMLLTEAVP